MKICFNARPYYDDISVRLVKALRLKAGFAIHGIFVCIDEFETDNIINRLPDADVRQMNQYVKRLWDSGSVERLRLYEEKYDCSPIWKYIYTDRFLINEPYDYVVKTVCGMFTFYESIFEAGDIEYYYDEAIATMQSYTAYFVAKKYGTRYISQMLARGFDGTYHYIIDNPFQLNCNFNPDYGNKVYDTDIIVRAESFLNEFEAKDIKPEYMLSSGKSPQFSVNFFKLPLSYIKRRLNKKYNDPYSYIYYKQYKTTFLPLIYFIRYQKSRKYYNKADINGKFVLFPLHYQPEASTCVCAQKFEKQLYYIDSLAKSLPADTLLYVKEHYAILGHREIQFYKELCKFPNVVLIDPWENTRTLVKAAQAVTTLTGTVGWEAVLLRKPVIIAGNIFYQDAPGVTQVAEIYDQYKNILRSYRQPEREEIIKYLCEYMSTIRKGTVVNTAKEYKSEDNFNNVAESFLQQDKIWKAKDNDC